VKHCEVAASYQQRHRNCALKRVCAQVKHLKPAETTNFRRYLPDEVVVVQIQDLEKGQVAKNW
jgi:hypothetical protein